MPISASDAAKRGRKCLFPRLSVYFQPPELPDTHALCCLKHIMHLNVTHSREVGGCCVTSDWVTLWRWKPSGRHCSLPAERFWGWRRCTKPAEHRRHPVFSRWRSHGVIQPCVHHTPPKCAACFMRLKGISLPLKTHTGTKVTRVYLMSVNGQTVKPGSNLFNTHLQPGWYPVIWIYSQMPGVWLS